MTCMPSSFFLSRYFLDILSRLLCIPFSEEVESIYNPYLTLISSSENFLVLLLNIAAFSSNDIRICVSPMGTRHFARYL